MTTLSLERPIPFASSPTDLEEEAEEMEGFVYHHPVLVQEVVALLAAKPGSLMVDATCGGGGHTEALLEAGTDVVALDQDPDAVQFVTEHLSRFGPRIVVRQANFRHTTKVLDELGIGPIKGALLDLGV